MQSKWSQLPGFLYLLPLFGVIGYSVVPYFWAIWLSVLMAGTLVYWVMRQVGMRSLPLPQTSLLFGLMMALTVLQWMLGALHSHSVALTTLGYLLTAGWMVVVGQVLRQVFGWATLASVCARAALATALAISLVSLFSQQPFALWFNLKQTVSQLHDFAAVSMAMGLSAWLYLAVQQQLSRWLAVVTAALLLAGTCLLLGAHGWWLIALLVLVALAQQIVAIRTHTGSRLRRLWLHFALLSVPVYSVLCWQLPHAPQATTAGAWQTIKVAAHIAFTHPWLGVGAGNVGWQSFLAITHPAIPGRVGVFNHAPNAFVQLLLEFGLFALLAWVVALVTWLRAIHWRMLQMEQLWLLSSVGLLFAVSLFSAPFHHLFYLMLLAFLLGVGDYQVKPLKRPVILTIASLASLLALLAALATVGVANAKLTQAARGSLQHPDTLAQLQWVHRYTLLAPFAERLFVQKIQVDHHDIDSKLWLTKSVMRYQPEMRAAYYHSLLLELGGKHSQAVSYLNATLNAYPIKLNSMLAYFSPMYMQHFLNVLLDARPPKKPAQHTQMTKPNDAT